jgi:long-chain acyl-CoA synthetase
VWYCGGWRGRKCDIIEKIGDCGNQTYISYDSLKDRGKKMNYYKMLCEKDENKLAFVEDGIPYTYEELEKAADEYAEKIKINADGNYGTAVKGMWQKLGQCTESGRKVYMIKSESFLEQLILFIACNKNGDIPMIVQKDMTQLPEINEIPDEVCMAVMTSGTTGVPKILYRTYESWADFFPIQNEIFGIGENSRLFVQGSLAFTGNLNLVMAQLYAGAVTIVENRFNPKQWEKTIKQWEADTIYLIPSKLMCIPECFKEKNVNIKMILSGSQSLGRKDAESLKKIFPDTKVILYYGASELNYISYVTDENMTEKRNLIGKPFPKVDVSVKEGEIYVTNDFHVYGVKCPFTLKDRGYMEKDENKLAFVEDGIPYTYEELEKAADEYAEKIKINADGNYGTAVKGMWQKLGQCTESGRKVYMIKSESFLEQLILFIACNKNGDIPMIVQKDMTQLPEINEIPDEVCMAVMTSGTTGVPKILYRTYESWADFFPIQNEIFGIGENSRLFVQGSLAFTGNLNLVMAQLYAGAVTIVENRFNPKQWEKTIKQWEADTIYLIPSKLMCIPECFKEKNVNIKMILSGSQSLGRKDAESLKKIFPDTKVILYYGASELNYISYVTDENMTEKRNLIGKPFPKVDVSVKEGEIYVTNDFHVYGVKCPFTLKDRGYMDDCGNLYFDGRSDDIVGIRGRKVSKAKIEAAVSEKEEISEAVVILEKDRDILTLYVALKESVKDKYLKGDKKRDELEKEIYAFLRKKLAHFEMPRRIIILDDMPHNKDTGKIDKKQLLK